MADQQITRQQASSAASFDPATPSQNPTQNVMEGFKANTQSQVATSPVSQPPTAQPSPQTSQPSQPTQDNQFSATNSPSPLQDLQTLDMKTAENLAGLQNGQLPDTIDIAHLNQFTTLSNLGKLGSQGDVASGELPKGYDPKQNYEGFVGGQCTSYAAWRLNQEGVKFTDTGNGNAKNWASLAQKQGLSVTEKPQVGSVVVWPSMGQYGHVAYVEGINKDGSINVSEMNYQPGKYTTRSNVSTSGAQFIK